MSFPCLKKTPAVGNAGMLYPRDPRLRGMDRIIGRRCRIWPPRPPKPTSGSNIGTPPSHVLSKQALNPIRPSYSMATPNDDSGRRAKPPPPRRRELIRCEAVFLSSVLFFISGSRVESCYCLYGARLCQALFLVCARA